VQVSVPPGFYRAKNTVEECVKEGNSLKVDDAKFVTSIISELHQGLKSGTDGSNLEIIQGALGFLRGHTKEIAEAEEEQTKIREMEMETIKEAETILKERLKRKGE